MKLLLLCVALPVILIVLYSLGRIKGILFVAFGTALVSLITYFAWMDAPKEYVTLTFAGAFVISVFLFLLNSAFDGGADRISKRLEQRDNDKRFVDYDQYIGRLERSNGPLTDTEKQRVWDDYYQ